MKKHNDYARVVRVNKMGIGGWKELYKKHDNLFKGDDFVFRGQANADWKLKTSLDRYAEHIDKDDKPKLEEFFLEEFQRRYHNYSQRTPEKDNLIEWWAIMQHYGTPTRLLDWTYSFYAALFFALEDLDNKKESAVWAINFDWLWKQIQGDQELVSALEKDNHMIHKENFEKFKDKPNILRLSPYLLHARLSVQQGCFLIPGRADKTFIENLVEFAGSKDKLKKDLYKIIIPADKSLRRIILEDLYRMNISRASLFPELDGFALSLRTIPYAMPKLLNKKQKLWGGSGSCGKLGRRFT